MDIREAKYNLTGVVCLRSDATKPSLDHSVCIVKYNGIWLAYTYVTILILHRFSNNMQTSDSPRCYLQNLEWYYIRALDDRQDNRVDLSELAKSLPSYQDPQIYAVELWIDLLPNTYRPVNPYKLGIEYVRININTYMLSQ